MDSIWRKELQSMTPEEAMLGWAACKNSGDRYPCTLPQFISRVSEALKAGKPVGVYLGQKDDEANRIRHEEAAKRAMKELPAPDNERMERMKKAKSASEAALKEMATMLGKK